MTRRRLGPEVDSVVSNVSTADQFERTQKVILFLGASPQQLAPIKYAKQAGFRVITCDNRPENPGHRLAHIFYDISTTDMQAVYRVASDHAVDAVIAYGSDVGAPTAAWVAERLGLSGNRYDAVITLTNKGKFRKFQKERGYFTPKFLILDQDHLEKIHDSYAQIINELRLPFIVKPVDASGSKGISRIHEVEQLPRAVALAAMHSRSSGVVIEELVPYVGYQICGEGFLHDGKIIFHAFADEHFVTGILPPVGETFPSFVSEEQVQQGIDVLQRIFDDVGMRRGPFNFDLVYLATGEVFVIEIGPRNGGNRMPEAISAAYGVDMIDATIKSALGFNVTLDRRWLRYCATYSVHSNKSGIFRFIEYDQKIQSHIMSEQIFVVSGDRVERFEQGGNMLGCLILSFDSHKQMISKMNEMDQLVRVSVDDVNGD
ncbi:acetyl-CoA carboxylase biotin carboxylase subunit family protein [Hydrogenophaga sp.]|uniref:ATP-grasp domain-containing protein n=1 Tax=Hydrogenophaga sp. TaxID=1904254 RepID=UPI0027369D58|nr:ATP-grasp domain-containing protein [Hydrogenophaga sp.]MDP3883883.1 ATP-grasp domain-containing protein [Hydrogenophaga sp.]